MAKFLKKSFFDKKNGSSLLLSRSDLKKIEKSLFMKKY